MYVVYFYQRKLLISIENYFVIRLSVDYLRVEVSKPLVMMDDNKFSNVNVISMRMSVDG
jgi:hypothetical protein